MQTLSITQEIWIDAPPERVWDALTQPEQIEAWFSPGAPWEIPSLEVGGQAIWHSSETETDLHRIEIVEPLQRFALRWLPEPPGTPLLTTYIIEADSRGTHLTVMESGYELLPEDQREKRMESGNQGHAATLQDLKKYLEDGERTKP